MRYLLFLWCSCYCTWVFAQGNDEIGLFTERSSGSIPKYQYFFNGLEYAHSLSQHFAYTIGAGYGKVGMDNLWHNYQITNDTFYEKPNEYVTNIVVPMVSAGLKYQHRAFKHGAWFVGTDFKVGYDYRDKDSLYSVGSSLPTAVGANRFRLLMAINY